MISEPFRTTVDQLDDLKLCLDVACIHQYLDAPLQAYVEPYMDRICYLHLYANTEDIVHLPPDAGDVPEEDWIYMMETLKVMNFNGPAVFEIKSAPGKENQTAVETVREAEAYLTSLLS
jgi:sugar phosphate isomerase/epimerase